MGYVQEAVVGAPEMPRPVVARWPVAALVTLGGGLALVPMTDALVDAAGGGAGGSAARLGVRREGGLDEFDAAGLGRHRDTADWLARERRA